MDGVPGRMDGRSGNKVQQAGLHGQVICLGDVHLGLSKCDPDTRWLWLYKRLSGREDAERYKAHGDRRGNKPGPEIGHCKTIVELIYLVEKDHYPEKKDDN